MTNGEVATLDDCFMQEIYCFNLAQVCTSIEQKDKEKEDFKRRKTFPEFDYMISSILCFLM